MLSISEALAIVLHPVQTGRMLYEGLKVLGGMELSEWGNIGQTMVESFLTTGREGVGEWTTPTNSAVASYLVGFTSGYIAEQVAVTYLTAGVIRMVEFGPRMSSVLRAAARGVAPVLEAATELRTRAQKIKNSIFRRFSRKHVANPSFRHRGIVRCLVDAKGKESPNQATHGPGTSGTDLGFPTKRSESSGLCSKAFTQLFHVQPLA